MIGAATQGPAAKRSMSNKSYQQYREGTYPAARVLLCLPPENPQPSIAKGNRGLPGYYELGRLGLLHTTSRCLLLCPIHFS